ncbi:MAG TPA: DUF2231 domain-containing protein [Gemmatimonadales bacterium]|nr:DUF2231 domain-containing protein [Gemmatimonadales bacterium]
MLPNPLHPAVVHFPIVFMVLLPFVALGAIWAIRRGASPRRAWAFPLVTAAVLTLSGWIASRTGESEEERVENAVSEQALEGHEEAAERFVVLSAALLAVAAAGLLRGGVGRSARIVASAGAVGLAALGAQVGHTGGELVYRHGAASAYTATPAEMGAAGAAARSEREAAARSEREAEDD